MEFTFTTSYDQKATAAMARAIRKTVRAKHSRRSHVFGWIVVILGILLTLPLGGESFHISGKTVVTWLAVLAVMAALLWEDQINGYFARKRNLPDLSCSVTTFTAEGYHSVTKLGTSDFSYESISALAETKDFFVLIFGKNHAQVYAKDSITGGSTEDFRAFLESKTDKKMIETS